ncbi:MAG: LysR family transcriptional regulator, partial [Rhodobacterales bacterium]|nr:LysR family transcriptional regulator [Rhodobacterales bacterium]
LDDLAGVVAGLLRPLLQDEVVAPALARHPWLAGRLAVCG